MGQYISMLKTKSATSRVSNGRTKEPTKEINSNPQISTVMAATQTDSLLQNRVETDEQLPSPSAKQRRFSNTTPSPSINGCNTNTMVESTGSPTSSKQRPINFSNRQPFDLCEPSRHLCSVDETQAFRVHDSSIGLEIICPGLRGFLGGILNTTRTIQGNDLLPRLAIPKPYQLIIHNRNKIWSRQEETEDHVQGHLEALFQFIREEDPLTWEKLDEIEKNKCCNIAFKDLWLLFPPGETVLNRDDGSLRAYKVGSVEMYSESRSEKLSIHCWFLDFDKSGKCLVPHRKVFHVLQYSSERPIMNLDVIPDWCFDNLSMTLIERGKKYWRYGNVASHKQYNGDAWPRMPQQDPINVIIDYVTSSKHQKDAGIEDPHHAGLVCSTCQANDAHLVSYPGDAPHDSEVCKIKQKTSSTGSTITNIRTRMNFLRFCPASMWAFSLRHKSWKTVPVQELSDIQPQDESFERLQMDGIKKKSLEQLICDYLTRKTIHSTDPIKGKGQGLNILLSGEPGTGKTLAVESLCQKYRIPLYMLTCGELGNGPDAFEDRLQIVFHRAANWGAILLFEEADIFVHSRQRDLQRCAIVSSFLSKLDYSCAMVVMATNQVKSFDKAFLSRVTAMFQFPNFSFEVQKKIWIDAINHLQDVNQGDKELIELWVESDLETFNGSKHLKMNGRQIRNCVSAALALARADKNDKRLRDIDIQKVLLLGSDFKKFLGEGDDADIDEEIDDRMRQDELAWHAGTPR